MCQRIKEYLKLYNQEEVDTEHIQLYDTSNYKLPYGSQVKLENILQDENCLNYEILPFRLRDLENNLIVRV